MEGEADVTSSLRHLRLNSGDMNTIFVSGARKLNGQTAAIVGICALHSYFTILCSAHRGFPRILNSFPL